MSSAPQWQPNGGKKGSRNSGTKDSINDRPCDKCGVVREHPQRTAKYPQKVYCCDCHRAEGFGITKTHWRMRPNKEETEEADRLRREGGARGVASQAAACEQIAAANERTAALVAATAVVALAVGAFLGARLGRSK